MFAIFLKKIYFVECILFDGHPLNYLRSTVKNSVADSNTKYKNSVNMMIKKYISEDQKQRLLEECRAFDLKQWFTRYPVKSETKVVNLII